ncbi:hypothetical protein CTheo_8584 [Ceratobasidium theobromae]|uniref:Uncharacterized protein n=1 Tax=Ceratobasidium theobromae TaxID=1582974 RepID=A0A5N5Q8H6_9AGAM|nr:hypothetical protein CTheo_8584 [Ceratobasidium theobromae]
MNSQSTITSSNSRRRHASRSVSRDRGRDRRRRRSRSDDPPNQRQDPLEEDEEEEPITNWATRKKLADPYGLIAREITRTIDMYWEPREVVLAGVHLLSLDSQDNVNAEIASASDKKRKVYHINEVLSEKLPDYIEKLGEGEKSWEEVRQRLERGKTSAKTEDNLTFKRWLPAWYPWSPALGCLKKSERGLTHKGCAELLRPITVDWTDESAQRKFRVENDPPMSADNWPALIWRDNIADLDHLEVGLFQNKLLLQAARAVLFPPTIANAQDPLNNKSNRQPKATRYGMTSVTPGFLAYVAVALRYTLSSEETFMESSGVFDYRLFYNDLVTYLEAPDFEDQARDLTKWWNECIFPPKQTSLSNNTTSILSRLRQQRERDAAQEAANEASDEAGGPN